MIWQAHTTRAQLDDQLRRLPLEKSPYGGSGRDIAWVFVIMFVVVVVSTAIAGWL